MNVIFVEPFFPQNQRRFVAALAGVGANVIGVGEYDEHELGDELRGQLAAYYKVSNVTDEAQLNAAVEWAQSHDLGGPARVNDRVAPDDRGPGAGGPRDPRYVGADDLAVPGQAVDEGGAARGRGADGRVDRRHTVDQAVAFANAIGFPLILKPRGGAGAQGTTRVDSMAELHQALVGVRRRRLDRDRGVRRGPRGLLRHDRRSTATSPTTGSPTTTPTCSRRCGTAGSRRSSSPPTGSRLLVLRRGPRDGRAGDRGARDRHVGDPHGVVLRAQGAALLRDRLPPARRRRWDLYSAANDVDVYREWAHAIVHGSTERPLSRAYSAGIVALRPDQDGQIRATPASTRSSNGTVSGSSTPTCPTGTGTQPVEAGYMANAWVRMRHPDYDTARGMLDDVGRTITRVPPAECQVTDARRVGVGAHFGGRTSESA